MAEKLSHRLKEIVDALPLKNGIGVLEIGCGTGAAARAIANRLKTGSILVIDRSAKAIQQAIAISQPEIMKGTLSFRQSKIEDFILEDEEPLFDIAFAIRVGALEGRHPEIEALALTCITRSLHSHGRLFIDGGNPLKEIPLNIQT